MTIVPRLTWLALSPGVLLVLVLLSACADERDITAPRLTFDAVQSPTKESPLILSGTVEEGATVEISVTPPPTTIGPVSIEGDKWSSALELPDSPSTTYSVSVSAADPRGNRSTSLFSFIFDNIAEVTLEQAISPVRPESPQTLAGTIEPGSELLVEVDNLPLNVFINVNTWRAELPGLADSRQVVIKATDRLGNTAELLEDIVVTNSAIPLTISSVSPSNQTGQTVTVAADAEVEVLLARGGTPAEKILPVEGTQAYPLSGLVPGKNVLAVTANAIDLAETTAKVLLFVDQLRPVVTEVVRDTEAVHVRFSEAVKGVSATTFVLKNALGEQVPGEVLYDLQTKTALFTPSSTLSSDSPYRVELVGSVAIPEEGNGSYVADLAGNPLLPNSAGDLWVADFTLPAPSGD
jgi:hypothetical protein